MRVVGYVVGGLVLLIVVALVLDSVLFRGWSWPVLLDVCLGLWFAHRCFRPLLTNVERGRLVRYVVGAYFVLGGASRVTWAVTHVDEKTAYNLGIGCAQFVIAIWAFWPLLNVAYKKRYAKADPSEVPT